jgi:hypothetical protein
MHIRRRMLGFLIVIAILQFAAIVNAEECYEWVDDKGVTHFTSSVDLVPEQYRSTMKPCGTTSGPGLSIIKEDTETKSEAAQPQDQLGRTREYWVKRVAEARERLRQEEDKYERLRIAYWEAERKLYEATSTAEQDAYTERRESLKAQMEQQALEVNKAREYLDVTLPKEAEQDGAPAEWLQ